MPNQNDAPKASGQPLAKTASSPTALNLVTKRATPTATSALSPLARHSQLSDSGAESCGDGDEQRLIRHPSMRPHKYIIIPATPSSPGASGSSPPQLPFRQTNSTTSLVAMAAAMHKQPPRQASSSKIKSRPNSDVIQPAQHLQLPQLPQPATSTSTVTFTIDDCEPPAAPAQVLAAPPPTAAHYTTPTTLTCTTTTTMATGNDAGMAVSPLSYDMRNRMGSHHSSMRSVVSCKPGMINSYFISLSTLSLPPTAYLPGLSDSSCNLAGSSAANYGLKPPNPLYMQPQSSLSGSSYHLHELVGGNQIYSDVTSVRSLASIGIGSTDGRKLVIRRVPTTANELFDMVNPQTPP